jgi:hypothetical protein
VYALIHLLQRYESSHPGQWWSCPPIAHPSMPKTLFCYDPSSLSVDHVSINATRTQISTRGDHILTTSSRDHPVAASKLRFKACESNGGKVLFHEPLQVCIWTSVKLFELVDGFQVFRSDHVQGVVALKACGSFDCLLGEGWRLTKASVCKNLI